MMKAFSVKEANYTREYQVEIIFNDGSKKMVDFGNFLKSHSHPQYNKYKKIDKFKQFKIENGHLVWGKDRDMIFPVYDLYKGKIEIEECRSKAN